MFDYISDHMPLCSQRDMYHRQCTLCLTNNSNPVHSTVVMLSHVNTNNEIAGGHDIRFAY